MIFGKVKWANYNVHVSNCIDNIIILVDILFHLLRYELKDYKYLDMIDFFTHILAKDIIKWHFHDVAVAKYMLFLGSIA